MSYPNGQKALFTYFGNLKDKQLNIIEHVTSAATLLNRHTYDYTVPGEITSWNQQGGSGGTSTLYGLGYDAVGQLVQASINSGAQNLFYHYDRSGNRIGVQKQESSGATISLTSGIYGEANVLWRLSGGGPTRFAGQLSEPASVTVNGVAARVDGSNKFEAVVPLTSGTHNVAVVATDLTGNENTTTQTYQVSVVDGMGTEDFDYDFNGNLIQDGTKTYEWDAANRLIAINYTGTTKRTEFTYDGLGRRIKNVEKDDGVVIEEKNFIWSGLELCEQRDSNNLVTRRFYSQGEQIGGVSYYYQHYQHDHLGSVRELTDSAEAVKARYDYDLWGNRSENQFTGSGVVESEFGFTGHYYHPGSKLHLAPYRAYDARIGRWISRDPIGEEGGLNLYGYVRNNPANAVDPDGRNPIILVALAVWFGMDRYANAPGPSDPIYSGDTGKPFAYIDGVAALPGLAKGTARCLMQGAVKDIAGKIALREGDAILAVVKDGEIIAKGSPALSHVELVKRLLGGVLPQGAEVVTIGKSNGTVMAITSQTFAGKQVPASAAAQAAAQASFY